MEKFETTEDEIENKYLLLEPKKSIGNDSRFAEPKSQALCINNYINSSSVESVSQLSTSN